MYTVQLKRLPQRFALSLAAIFASTLFVYAWPGFMEHPEVLAVSELAGFALVVGLAKRYPAFRRPVTALARMGTSELAAKPHRSRPGAPSPFHDIAVAWFDAGREPVWLLSEPGAYRPAITTPECERLLFQVRTAWDSPVERISWILRFAYKDAKVKEQEYQHCQADLSICMAALFVEHAQETSQLRTTLMTSGPKYEMMLLEDDPVVGALVEHLFQEYGVVVRRLPLPPDVSREAVQDWRRLRHFSEPLGACFSVRFERANKSWPIFPLTCLERGEVLEELLPTRIAGIGGDYVVAVQRCLNTIVRLGHILRSSDAR